MCNWYSNHRRWNPPWRGEGAYPTKRFRPVCHVAQRAMFPEPWNIMKSSKISRKYQLSTNFLDKKKPFFLSLKCLKQKLFRIQKTWYSMLKKISPYINFLNQKKTVFIISEKFKTRTFPYYELFFLFKIHVFIIISFFVLGTIH